MNQSCSIIILARKSQLSSLVVQCTIFNRTLLSGNGFKVKVSACTSAWSSFKGPGGLIPDNLQAGYAVLGRAWTGSLTYFISFLSYDLLHVYGVFIFRSTIRMIFRKIWHMFKFRYVYKHHQTLSLRHLLRACVDPRNMPGPTLCSAWLLSRACLHEFLLGLG